MTDYPRCPRSLMKNAWNGRLSEQPIKLLTPPMLNPIIDQKVKQRQNDKESRPAPALLSQNCCCCQPSLLRRSFVMKLRPAITWRDVRIQDHQSTNDQETADQPIGLFFLNINSAFVSLLVQSAHAFGPNSIISYVSSMQWKMLGNKILKFRCTVHRITLVQKKIPIFQVFALNILGASVECCAQIAERLTRSFTLLLLLET